MAEFKEILRRLCSVMTVTGCEKNAVEEVKAMFSSDFDEIRTDLARNIILVKHSKHPTKSIKPKVLIDAHMDEVGMIVSGITDEGFLRVTPVGGIDRRLIPSAEVWVYGKEKLYGTISSYSSENDRARSEKTPDWNDVLVDIGYNKEEAEKLVELGTPVGYYYEGDELLNGRLTGRGLDDKCCAATVLTALINTPAEELLCDAYAVLSTGEENGRGGVSCAAHAIRPDFALICDVNFASQPGSPEGCAKLESGPMISLSAATNRRFTKHLLAVAKENEIPTNTTIEPTSTGTNAECVACVNEGVATAVLGLPLGGMHSFNEELSTVDAEHMIKLISKLITTELY